MLVQISRWSQIYIEIECKTRSVCIPFFMTTKNIWMSVFFACVQNPCFFTFSARQDVYYFSPCSSGRQQKKNLMSYFAIKFSFKVVFLKVQSSCIFRGGRREARSNVKSLTRDYSKITAAKHIHTHTLTLWADGINFRLWLVEAF
jgi:hypothetical protein